MKSVTAFGIAADETAFLTALKALATSAMWTVVDALTTPVGSVWFTSNGESGYNQICAGILDTGSRFRCYTAADFDPVGFVTPGLQAGYTNYDSLGHASPSIAQTSATAMPTRDGGAPYVYAMSADRDSIRFTLRYLSGAAPAQTFGYLGTVDPHGPGLATMARARIETVTPLGGSVRILLNCDITNALKDTGPGTAFPADPAQLRLFFQTVYSPGILTSEFAQTERAPAIVPLSLTTVGGKTQLDIPLVAPAVTKLFGAGQRYDSGRGAGDLVRMHSMPTLAIIGGSNAGATPFTGLTQAALAAWDGFGGQGVFIDVTLRNYISVTESTSDPDVVTNRVHWYAMYVLPIDQATSIIAQTSEGKKTCGALHGAIMTVNNAYPDLAIFTINNDLDRRYMLMVQTGLALLPPSTFSSNDLCYAVGPGF